MEHRTERPIRSSGHRTFLIPLVCLAEVIGMAAYAGFPAQLLLLAESWQLSATDAGWISGAFYGGYALAVPILVPLTDRRGALPIYLPCMLLTAGSALAFALLVDGFWSAILMQMLMGIGLAGTYMPGLRLLTDRFEGRIRSRAVALYTSSYAVGTGLSFALIGLLSSGMGWRWAFGLAAVGPAVAFLLVALLFRRSPSGVQMEASVSGIASGWAVLKDRIVLSRAIAYSAHCFELFGLWSWAVAFLAFAYSMRPGEGGQVSPALVTAALTVMLLPASVGGNEVSLRVGRVRWIVGVMSVSAICAMGLGFVVPHVGTWGVIALMLLYSWTTSAGSGALTSSLVEEARPEQRGAAMALYSTLGFAGAFAGPLVFGVALDRFGMSTVQGWGAAFAAMGLAALVGPLALLTLGRPRRSPVAAPKERHAGMT
jgi:MFS family permease